MKKRVLKEEIRRLKRRLEIERGEKLLHLQYSVDLAKDFRVLHEQYEARGQTIHEMCEQFREKKKRIHAFYAPQQVNRKAENAELDQVKKCLVLVIGQKIRLAEYLEEMECQLEDMKEDVSFYRRKWLESVKPDDGMAGTTDEAEYRLKLLADALKSIAAVAGEVEWILQKEAS